jgi:hypothetical protein
MHSEIDDKLTGRIEIDQTQDTLLVGRDESHLTVMYQEVGSGQRHILEIFSDNCEFVWLILRIRSGLDGLLKRHLPGEMRTTST